MKMDERYFRQMNFIFDDNNPIEIMLFQWMNMEIRNDETPEMI